MCEDFDKHVFSITGDQSVESAPASPLPSQQPSSSSSSKLDSLTRPSPDKPTKPFPSPPFGNQVPCPTSAQYLAISDCSNDEGFIPQLDLAFHDISITPTDALVAEREETPALQKCTREAPDVSVAAFRDDEDTGDV